MSINCVQELEPLSRNQILPARSQTYIRAFSSNTMPVASDQGPVTDCSMKPEGSVDASNGPGSHRAATNNNNDNTKSPEISRDGTKDLREWWLAFIQQPVNRRAAN